MLSVLCECPTFEEGFVVQIPTNFTDPAPLQHPWLNVVFDAHTNQSWLVEGSVPCRGTKHTVVHGTVAEDCPTLALCHYVETGTPLKIAIPPYISRYYTADYSHIANKNCFVPLVKWLEYSTELYAVYSGLDWDTIDQADMTAYTRFLAALRAIESNGLAVDPLRFARHFDAPTYPGNLVYTRYNPYTATGRPSNAYHHVNYAALPKEDHSRRAFVSRFKGGQLVEFDFRSYHVHLVADLVGYKFDTDDVHTYLGQHYYKTATLTEEQYEQGKARTFKALYSSDRPSHPFFDRIEDLASVLYQEHQAKGYVTSPIFRRRIAVPQPNANKVFNYFVQAYETEKNSGLLSSVLFLLHGHSTKLVLYTYDAILIDLDPREQSEILPALIEEVSKQEVPFSVKIGPTYGDLVSF